MYLVDSSIWVAFFRADAQWSPEELIDLDRVVTCPTVVQEVLQGFDDERSYRIARDALLSFPIVESPVTLEAFEKAVDLYRLARRVGLTVRSGADCLIAACALRSDLAVLHLDRDFDALARVSQLRVESP